MIRYLPLVLVAFLILPSCATSQIQRARQIDVDVHAAVTGLDDAEWALCNPDAAKQCHSAIPAYTTELHARINTHILTMLKAAKALNEAVLTAPVPPASKANLVTVSAEVKTISDLLKPVLPANSAVLKWVDTVTQDILAVLPIFLQ